MVVAARALAPWPLWLVLWGALGGGRDRGSLYVFVTTALVVALMARRAVRGADRNVTAGGVVSVVSLALGANFFFAVVSGMALPHGHLGNLGWVPAVALGWIAGAGCYELGKRCLAQPDLGPSRLQGLVVDIVAHQALFAAPLLGLVDLRGGGLPLPLLVGPLVAVRVAGWHDARMPAPSASRLHVRTLLGVLAVAALVAALVLPPGVPGSTSNVLVVLSAAVSSLLAAAVLVHRAGVAARCPWGVVYERRPDGIVLSVRGGSERLHVVPTDPRPGSGLPLPESPITLVDLEPLEGPGAPYRDGPPMTRARIAWRGTADQLASTLLARAWGWLAWSALAFAVAVRLLG